MTMTASNYTQRSRELFEPALRNAVASLDPTSAEISAYHLGWTEADGTPTTTGGGKAIRPTLALLSAQAVGATAESGVPGAVAVELVHNFSLLHDDVIDQDRQRRHRATAWTIWGVPKAILAGDAMLALAHRVLLDSGSPHAVAADRLMLTAIAELIRGQMDDVDFEQRDVVTLEECQTMAAGKTGSLLSASAAIGAVLAGASNEIVQALASFGADVGAAFQLVDDLLGIWGDPEVTGKPVLADLRARKKSLPVSYVLSLHDDAASELASWLRSTGPDDEAELQRVATLIDTAGGRRFAEEEAQRRIDSAVAALQRVSLDPAVRAEMTELAMFVVGRDA